MVRTIAICHNMGETPEEIAASYEHLTLAQIHAAISYYYANRDEIDTDIADESALYDKLCRDNAHPR